MKDRLLFGTIGLLVGIVVMQWTMPSGQAGPISPVTGLVSAYDEIRCGPGLFLDSSGAVWELSDGGWFQQPGLSGLPLPLDQVKFWGPRYVVSISNEGWLRSDCDGPWQNIGPWPGTPVATDQSTWGKVKARLSGK